MLAANIHVKIFVTRVVASLLVGAAIGALYMVGITTRYDRTILPRSVLNSSVYLDTATGFVNHFVLPDRWRSGMSLMFAEGSYCFPDPYLIEFRRYVLRSTLPNALVVFLFWSAGSSLKRRTAQPRDQAGG